jgi:excisionase family DNA binding protein
MIPIVRFEPFEPAVQGHRHQLSCGEEIEEGLGMELLTVHEAADLTGLSVETLNQWRSQRRHIPYVKLGKAVRYLRKDVELYILRCRVEVPPDRRRK